MKKEVLSLGQRLVFEITKDDKTIMTAYYHWSGYSSTSMTITKMFYEALQERQPIHQKVTPIDVYHALLATGAGPSLEMLADNDANYPKPDEYKPNRNEGLIDVVDEHMERSLGYAEMLVVYDLTTDTFPVTHMFIEYFTTHSEKLTCAIDDVLEEIGDYMDDATPESIQASILDGNSDITKALYAEALSFDKLVELYDYFDERLTEDPYVVTSSPNGPNGELEVSAWTFQD